MTEVATTSTQAADIEHAASCIRCGYDLRGSGSSTRCPECGLDMFWSLRAPKQLAQYPAPWVSAMARGTRLLALTYGFGFAALILGLTGYLPDNAELAVEILAALALMHAIGACVLAQRSGHYTEAAASVTRWALGVLPALLLVGATGTLALRYHYILWQWHWAVFAAMGIGLASPVPIFVRLRAVARMIADEGLAEHSVIVAFGFLGTALAIGAMTLFDALRNSSGNSVWTLAVVGLTATAALLFILWGAFIMICCVIDFGRAARVARAEWNAGAAAV
jgi:hypothetical protein